MTTTWILILFAVFDGGASSAVRVGFDSQITCTAGAKEVAAQLKQSYPTAKIDWSCIQQ